MGKFKGIIVGVCEDYESGISVYSLSQAYGLPMCEVVDILRKFGGYEVFPSASESEVQTSTEDSDIFPKISITAKNTKEI